MRTLEGRSRREQIEPVDGCGTQPEAEQDRAGLQGDRNSSVIADFFSYRYC